VNREDTTSFLSRTSLFSSLSQTELKHLVDLLKSKEYPEGEIVFHQGDFGDSLYLICQGEVEVFIRNQEGAENTISRLKEGDLFGEMALLTGSLRSASVRVSRDALFLVLHKNDFEAFLTSHPHLALLFSKVLVERLQTVNIKYVHQVDRESELKRLLSKEEEIHLTRLIGKTKHFQAIEKRIDELARMDEPMIIAGPKGTTEVDVARLIHLKSRRQDRPFLTVDLGGGDEWASFFSRLRSSVKTPEEEKQLFEEFQISTLFGHERGAMTGTEASRLGQIELADGGTVVLRNIDRLSPGTREKLLLYSIEKRFYRLGGREGRFSDTRIIGTLSSSEGSEEAQRSLKGKVPDLFWNHRIDLPTLAARRRDIQVIAESFLEKHALLSDKSIKHISPQALNVLVRYSWPGNDRELESVIERGVLVCDGDTLSDEHIFLGLTPFNEKGRLNLLRIDPFRNLFANQRLRSAFQAITISLLLAVALFSFLGVRVAGQPLGTGIFWTFMLPYLLLSYVVLGRIYCSICPLIGLARLFRRVGSKDLKAPKIFNPIGVGVAAFFALAFLWFETAYAVREIPYTTAVFIVLLISAAVLLNLIFKEEVWCRYLCPMGYLGGLFSCLAPVELRANNNVCTSQCRAAACYQGNKERNGCPMSLFPVSMTSNQFCKMCGTCVQNCSLKSIHLDLRWPGAEIWENREPNLVASLSIPALLGVLYPLILQTSQEILADLWPFTLAFLASGVLALILFAGACLLKGYPSFRGILRSHGFVYLPLTFAGHIAFQVPFMEQGLRWITGNLPGGGPAGQGLHVAQGLLIVLGSLWSLWSLKKLFKREEWPVCIAHGVLILFFGALLLFTLGL
jgi:DNA-binding NtrC family response regulator/Pyruvate/2-oxoacid:ferredoxin oxidoreductase delta subunit